MKSSKPRKAVDDAEAFEANQSPDMTVHRNACQTFIQDMRARKWFEKKKLQVTPSA